MKTSKPNNHRIGIIAFEGISLFHLSVPCTVFGDALEKLNVPRYEIFVCAEKLGPVATLSRFSVHVDYDLKALDSADTIIVPAWSDPDHLPSKKILNALVKAHKRGARLVGLCLGAFVLAEAGLLENKVASTHWVWAEEFRKKYPNVKLDSNKLYVDDGHILTSAGTAAALDCCIHIVRSDHGPEIANRLARRLVTAPHRSGDQAQYIEQPLPKNVECDRIARAMEWATKNLKHSLSLAAIAKHSAMSPRNFSREFRKQTGMSVGKWLLAERLARAQYLLEKSEHNIDSIASEAGFSSSTSLRQHFMTAFSVSPSSYRRQFKFK